MVSLDPYNGVLGRKNAVHLLRRATFGATRKEIDQVAGMTPNEAVTLLLTPPEEAPLPPIDPTTGAPWIDPANGRFAAGEANSDENELKKVFKAWWLAQMKNGGLNAVEKMTFFLHTMIPVIESRIRNSAGLYYQIALFRYYALGNFKEMAAKLCIDNAMLRHLDGKLNVDGRPQENFAREFFELYTIGKGPQVGDGDYTTFTEDDVREAARVLSGWDEDGSYRNLDPESGLALGILKGGEWVGDGYVVELAKRHDAGTKQFSERFQNRVIEPAALQDGFATAEAAATELQDLVDMIFEQEATARHICRKLYRFFVYYKIDEEIENGIIAPMAQTLIANDYVLKPVLEQVFQSQHFYDLDNAEQRDNNIGAIIKSPLELTISTMRFFGIEMPDPQNDYAQIADGAYDDLLKYMAEEGMDFMEPYEVAGFPAYHQSPVFHRNWISSNYLAQRYRLADHFLMSNDMEMQKPYYLDVMVFVNNPDNITDPSDPEKMVQEFLDYMLPEEVPQERFDYYLNAVLLDTLSVLNWQAEWQNYQGSGDDTAVRVQLEALVRAIMQSPEYQLQ